jgi:hypothetical protein
VHHKPQSLNEYYNHLNEFGKAMYTQLRSLIYQDNTNVCETLFVSNPYYYLKQYEGIKPHFRPSIMMVFYKDHVNIFAHAVKEYKARLEIYKVTDKETLQIYYDKPLLNGILIELFEKSIQPQEVK